jgi:chromosome segregation ATPase
MKKIYYGVLALAVSPLFSGCANQTTDPHQGGLFSYNPQAYEQRLQNKRKNLSTIDQANLTAQQEAARLEGTKSQQIKELERLNRKQIELTSTTAALEKKIRNTRTKTAAQKKEHDRILAEIAGLQSSLKVTDDMPDPEEKRLELERLKKKRDQLEQEAESLLLL